MTIAGYNAAVDAHADGLFRFALKHQRDRDLAKDTGQESFARLWAKVDQVDGAKAKSYLFTTAHHVIVDEARKGTRVRRIEEHHEDLRHSSQAPPDLKEVLDAAPAALDRPTIMKGTTMKTAIFLFALMAIAPAALAQTDTTRSETDTTRMQAVEVRVTADEGLAVRMKEEGEDSDEGDFSFDTKYKRVLLYAKNKPWASVEDSIAQRIKDARRERRSLFTNWAGIDGGVNFFTGPDGDADLDANVDFMQLDHGRSRFLSINFAEHKFEFGSHHAGLLTGLGWEFVSYRLANNSLLAQQGDSVFGVPVEAPSIDKNKLRMMGFRMPLMLEFNTKRSPLPTAADFSAMQADTTGAVAKRFRASRRHNVNLAFGVVGSWYFDTMYKQRYEVDGKTVQDRDKGDFNLLPYRLAAAARIGYGKFTLFAERSLTPLFRDGQGPELTPWNVTIQLVGFN